MNKTTRSHSELNEPGIPTWLKAYFVLFTIASAFFIVYAAALK